jgi:hypothetical protein
MIRVRCARWKRVSRSGVGSQHGPFYPLTLGDEVNFRLMYDGPLKAASQSDTRRVEKHRMRLAFAKQLDQLFHADELLLKPFAMTGEEYGHTVAKLGKLYRSGDYSFWPIVRESMHMVCDLDILFLRRGKPGKIISSAGDLDNRVKVLFDALRIPLHENEIRGFKSPDQRGFLCLLEDDKLITGFRVTSDRILEAEQPDARNDVRLIINVEIKVTKITDDNLGYLRQF